MARSPANGEGSKTEATTLIFPKKSAWDEMAEANALRKKRSSSANGTYSKVLARLVEEEHVDRRAASIVMKLDAIENDDDLHVTVFHLIDGLKKRGILKRAMAQEEMFDEHKIDDSVVDGAAPKRRGRPPGGGKKGAAADAEPEDDMTNVTRLGDAAARVVAEAAGEYE